MSVVLDVAIGVLLLYLLLALIVTTVQELIATWLRFRAKDLYDAIAGMLAGTNPDGSLVHTEILEALFRHPLIANLREKMPLSDRLHLPSYIPSQTFALALLDVLRRRQPVSAETSGLPLLQGARSAVAKLENHDGLKQALELLLDNGELAAARVEQEGAAAVAAVESWFNDRMSRASGWYKRRAQTMALVLGVVIAVACNADTIHVARALWANGALRDSIVAQAQLVAAAPNPNGASLGSQLATQVAALRAADFPLGWGMHDPFNAFTPLGWLLTGFAVSLGSGFWFDLLSKALQLRGTGPKISGTTGRTTETDS